MAFSELLNQYIEELGCSAKELAEASGLPASVISRYRTGARVPSVRSDNLPRLAGGIAKLSGNTDADYYEGILARLTEHIETSGLDYDLMIDNFNLLIEATDLNINRLAHFLNYDASFISRIRNGQRRPADPDVFADGVCRYVVANVTDKSAAAALIGKPAAVLDDQGVFYSELRRWLCSAKTEKPDSVGNFLYRLDEFDLNDYIRAIHFDELKVPTVPFRLPASKNYYGAEQMRQGELDFFKSTVLSKSEEPVFMCSDMPMEELAKDIEFGKKWMFAIAMTVKKGLHLNVIHNIHRPFSEMMLGLEGWIPLYMTGQVSPFYFHSAPTGLYQHLNYVSGAAALCGECISGHHAEGKYYFTNNREETAYYRRKSKALLEKARPLMEIYKESDAERWEEFMSAAEAEHGARRSILSSLPLYTMDDALLDSIMSRNGLADGERRRLREFAARQRQTMEKLLKSDSVTIEISETDKSEYAECPAMISVPEMFCGREMACTYSEYAEHLRQTKRFAELHENYSVHVSDSQTFRNIQIRILEDRYVVISKNRAPAIHFVIRNRKMVDAIQSFAPVV